MCDVMGGRKYRIWGSLPSFGETRTTRRPGNALGRYWTGRASSATVSAGALCLGMARINSALRFHYSTTSTQVMCDEI